MEDFNKHMKVSKRQHAIKELFLVMALQSFTDIVGGIVTCSETTNGDGVIKNLCDDGTYTYGKIVTAECQLDELLQGGYACPAGTNLNIKSFGKGAVFCSTFGN